MPYALVQKSLDQTIDQSVLEEASVYAPSVARADCARLGRQLFGVVVTGLPEEEAIAFQTALEHFGFPTEVVAQHLLPLLPTPKFRRGIRFHPGHFTAIDGLGREDSHPWDEVQFAAGGFVETVQIKSEKTMRWNYHYSPSYGQVGKSVKQVAQHRDVKEQEFRLELFLSREPYRLQFRAAKDTVFRCDDGVLRFNEPAQFLVLLQRVAAILPANCLSLGVLAAHRGETFVYPGIPALEEEITWQLFQRLRR